MISGSEADQLRREIAELREDLAALTGEVSRLRHSLAGLRAGSSATPPPTRSGGYSESEASYSVVDSVVGDQEGRALPTASPQLRDLRSPASPVLERQVANGGTISWHQREAIADEIGAWISRCISGLHRGSSGRDKNPLASRLWIVARDYEGIIYDPALVFRSFSGARVLCKRGPHAGDSVFVGVPSEREAERVIRHLSAMIEAGPLLETEEPFALVEQEVISDYPVGKLEVESESGGPTLRVIFVAEFDQKILVCLPSGAWHSRKASNRALPSGRFQKPSKLEVAACLVDERNTPVEGTPLKVWMGYFTKDFAAHVLESDMVEEVTVDFDGGLLPFSLALKDLSVEHFAFFSAAEPDGSQPEPGSADLGPRVAALETTLEDINEQLKLLVKEKGKEATSKVPGRPSALRKATAKATPGPAVVEIEEDFPDLDAGVVAAAKQAGVERSILLDMQNMVASNKKGAKVLKQTTPAVNASVLSESEEEIPEGGDGSASSSAVPPVESALAKLTTIVEHLAAGKMKAKKASALEQALDGVSSSTSEGGLLGIGKRSAAARRALRAALNDSPQELYVLIEKLMEEDIASQSLVPGLTAHQYSARAWMEHRSHIGAFKAVAHCGWGIAGVIDSLRNGNVSGARARANVLLLQIDQSCADRGSWTLASELALESPPPFVSLSQHRPPDVSSGELPYSRLLDTRWAEIALNHLREQDDFMTRRRNLGKAKPPGALPDPGEEELAAEPKKKVKPKPRPKAGSDPA